MGLFGRNKVRYVTCPICNEILDGSEDRHGIPFGQRPNPSFVDFALRDIRPRGHAL